MWCFLSLYRFSWHRKYNIVEHGSYIPCFNDNNNWLLAPICNKKKILDNLLLGKCKKGVDQKIDMLMKHILQSLTKLNNKCLIYAQKLHNVPISNIQLSNEK